jgi:hypothetical protein
MVRNESDSDSSTSSESLESNDSMLSFHSARSYQSQSDRVHDFSSSLQKLFGHDVSLGPQKIRESKGFPTKMAGNPEARSGLLSTNRTLDLLDLPLDILREIIKEVMQKMSKQKNKKEARLNC